MEEHGTPADPLSTLWRVLLAGFAVVVACLVFLMVLVTSDDGGPDMCAAVEQVA